MSAALGGVAVIAYVACGVITLRVINHFDSDPDDEAHARTRSPERTPSHAPGSG